MFGRRGDGCLSVCSLIRQLLPEEAERKSEELANTITEAEQALKTAKALQAEANAALKNAEEAILAEGSDSGIRQKLELHKAEHAANKRVAEARINVGRESELNSRLEMLSCDRERLARRRATISVPPPSALGPMRQLANELAAARGALDVGLLATVTPKLPIRLRVRKDGHEVEVASKIEPVDIEAKTDVELDIGDVATVHIRGGHREAQEKARELENRWSREVEPHLAAAAVTDLAGLDAKSAEARDLDSEIRAKDTESEALRAQIAGLNGAAEALRKATEHAASCRSALGDIDLDSLATDLKNLGSDAVAGLRRRIDKFSKETETARPDANQAASERMLGDERIRHSRQALEAATDARDQALTAFPKSLDEALSAARSALIAANEEKRDVAASFEARKRRIDEAVSGARTNAKQASAAVEATQDRLTAAKTGHAAERGRLVELRKQREAENICTAEARLQEAIASHAALPVPERVVTDDEVKDAQSALTGTQIELNEIEHDILRAHGALEQVGGAVARERLRDATEAFDLATRQEKEIEAEYDAWKLLLEQMKEADAAQASNLGHALGPAIAGRFHELTRRRYETVQLTAQLGTDGIIVSGAVRPLDQISIGTREQLSTLYRLSLAEYLRSTIVLDDQLVQSDDDRMEWFRALLVEKAASFQTLVFTCWPTDYLGSVALVQDSNAAHGDYDGGLIRCIDLRRVLHRR